MIEAHRPMVVQKDVLANVDIPVLKVKEWSCEMFISIIILES